MSEDNLTRVAARSVRWAFQYHYYRDMMNAAAHCAKPRFSPLTKRLCLEIQEQLDADGVEWTESGIDGFLTVTDSLMFEEDLGAQYGDIVTATRDLSDADQHVISEALKHRDQNRGG